MEDFLPTDHLDDVLAQWGAERPDLDVSPMALIGRLSIASRLVDLQLRQTFARHDLDSASFDVLATLRRNGPPYQLTPGELTHSAMVTSGAITQRLDKLEERGLVRRHPDPSDRRSITVTLTTSGRDLVDAALPDHVATEERLLRLLTPEDRRGLVAGLRLLIVSTAAAGIPN